VTPARQFLQNDIGKIMATVTPPSETPHRGEGPTLVITVGLPGSGKSTFARRLAPALDAVILQSDVLRRLLFETPVHAEGESKRLFRAIQAVTLRLLLAGRSVIVDATNLRETHRRPYYDIASKAGARLHVVHLKAPEDVILSRLAHRRDVQDPAEASQAYEGVYALLLQQEESPRLSHVRVDTSDPVAVDAALRKLEDQGNVSPTPPVAPLAGSGVSPA
jgi:predicted kinase